MQVDDFIQKVKEEPPRTVLRTRLQLLDGIAGDTRQPKKLRLSEIMSAKNLPAEPHAFVYRHVLGPPARQEAIAEWQAKHPAQRLPTDLLQLIGVCNGVHLWADAQTGRATDGLAPIEEWEIARFKLYGANAAPDQWLDDRYVAISYDVDGGAFVVLNTTSGEYSLVEASGPVPSSPIAANVDELLDWLWRRRIPPSD